MFDCRSTKRGWSWLGLLLLLLADNAVADYEFLQIENVFANLSRVTQIHPYAIVAASAGKPFDKLSEKGLNSYLFYQAKIQLNGKIYYRLVVGNFENSKDAGIALEQVKINFPDSWIYKRLQKEQMDLVRLLAVPQVKLKNSSLKTARDSPRELLLMARQEFIDENYARVITIADKVIASASLEQVREALELAGIARERQAKFSQALQLYLALLDTNPEPDMSARVTARIEGIQTMKTAPRQRLSETPQKARQDEWNFRGAVTQYYRDDVIDRPDVNSEEVNKSLVTDLDLYIQGRWKEDLIAIRFDGGWVNDFLENRTDSRVSRASVSYTDTSHDFRITGGRQSRSLTGVYGRFDGIVYEDVSQADYRFSYGLGYLVQSSLDGTNNDHGFIAVNINHNPYKWLELDYYLIGQEISGYTDRQALGTEFQMHNENGFIFGIVDYDLFYSELNNISLISSYQYSQQWTFNLTLDQRKSPLLSTVNALQGQAVASIKELGTLFSEDEIYQLAEDRTGNSNSIFLGTSYQIDANRQVYFNVSRLEVDAIDASGGVEAIAASAESQFSLDYSFRGYFVADDYTTVGFRYSDSSTREINSLRLRTRYPGRWGIVHEPRIRVDHRIGKTDGLDQWVLNPTYKIRYRASKRLNFEASAGFEYSDLNIPELDKQYAYSLYLGYYYIF